MQKRLHKTVVLENKLATPQMHTLYMQKPSEFEFSPGQYIKLRVEEIANSANAETTPQNNDPVFTIASHPSEKNLEFLIKKGSEITQKICKLAPGDTVYLSSPMGPGFPVPSFYEKTIYLLTHGSGISAIKPLLVELRNNRNMFGLIRLLYGARNPEDFAYKSLLNEWMGSIEYYDIISKDPHDLAIWNGEIGYVQDILKKISPSSENAVAVISGSPSFEKEILSILASFSFTPDQIFRNY